MKYKMETYFGEKTAHCEKEGAQLKGEMEKLANDMRQFNEKLQKTVKEVHLTNADLENMVSNKRVANNPKQADPNLVDISDALKGYKIRSEIERAFFFHLFYEILRQQFGLVGSQKEKDIFERKGSHVDIPIIVSSRDIKAVIEGREAFEKATQAERDKWMRQRE